MRAINPVQSLSMATNRRLVVPQCISHVTRKTTSLSTATAIDRDAWTLRNDEPYGNSWPLVLCSKYGYTIVVNNSVAGYRYQLGVATDVKLTPQLTR